MKNVFSLRKRSFLSPVSTGYTSHIFAEVESSNEGEYRWGHNMLGPRCQHLLESTFA